jgi:predicted ArsR family transcriptional regulator
VRQILNALQGEGLVAATSERQPQGRPRYVYTLARKGHDLFPDAYDTLAMELLETVRELGGEELLTNVMEKQLAKKEERYRLLMRGRSLAEKLYQLSELRDNDGYMAELDKTSTNPALLEHNCPLFRIAKTHPEICLQEMALMERLLGISVDRTHHILDGEHYCRFEVSEQQPLTPRPPPNQAGTDE